LFIIRHRFFSHSDGNNNNDGNNIVWEYISPVGSSGILSQGEDPANKKNIVFRAIKYPADYKAFKGRDLRPGPPIEKPRR